MTKAAAAPNYSEEEVTRIVSTYEAAKPDARRAAIEQLAVAMGRSARAITMKLVSLGKYKAAPKVSKVTGEAPVVKSELATELGNLVGLTEAETDSASKLTKTALLKILAALKSAESEA